MADPKFLSQRDLNFFKSMTAEVADMFFREVEFFIIDRENTVVDPEYTESKNIKYKSFSVRAQMDIKPNKAALKKFGIDETRDVMITVEKAVFERGNEDYPDGFPVPGPGDLAVIVGVKYKIMDDQEVDYWWHTETPFTHVFTLNRLRDRSIKDDELVDPANPAGPTQVPTYSYKDNPYPGEE